MLKKGFLFWSDWSPAHRNLLLALGLLLAFAFVSFWIFYLPSPSPAIVPQLVQEVELMEIPAHRFQKGIIELAVPANNYVLFERWLGSPLQIPLWSGYVYFFFILVTLTVFPAVFTTLGRFYYLICTGIFILFIVSLRLETLLLFGNSTKLFTIATLTIYVLGGFYIHYFARWLTFITRLTIFGVVSLIFGVVVFLFSHAELPLLQIAVNGMPAGIILTVLLALMVAHEIPASFIFIVSQGTRSSKSLNHFLIISVIYLINLALAYAIKFRFIETSILSVDLFLLFSVSVVLGLWGLRQRQKQFESILEIEPYGVLAYLSLSALCFSALAWLFHTANDAATDALADVIIFSHLGYGLIFMLYVISNFIGMLAKNMAVYKVLYNPTNMPYFTFRLGGLIATLAFVFYNEWEVPVQNAMAGYYNAVGDLHLSSGDADLAKAFYQRSGRFGYGNHHGHYALANIEGAQMNTALERTYYERASLRRPTPMSVLNWAQTYQTERNNLQALFTLKDALALQPDEPLIQNTIGYLFMKGGASDSAQVYFQNGSAGNNVSVAQSNLMGLSVYQRLQIAIDTLSHAEVSNYATFRNNLQAYYNLNQKDNRLAFALPTDTVLTRSEAAFINNYIVGQPSQLDTTTLNKIEQLARRPANIGQREALLFAVSMGFYEKGEIHKAYRLLEEVTINSSTPGKYNNVLTLWTLEQNEPMRALGYADYAIQQEYDAARLTRAVVLTETGNLNEAIAAWDSVLHTTDTINVLLASRMKNVLTWPANWKLTLSDEDKYLFGRYRIPLTDSLVFEELASTIENEDLRARAWLERSEMLYAKGRTKEAISHFQKIAGLAMGDKKIYDRLRLHELMLLAEEKNYALLEERLIKHADLVLSLTHKAYFEGLLAESKNDTTNATRLYKWLAYSNPFFEEGVVAATAYLVKQNAGTMVPYTALAEALQHHPSGVKLRKAYCLEAARAGFTNFTESALEDLRPLVTPAEWNIFAAQLRTAIAQAEDEE